jgi:hypothetical protein
MVADITPLYEACRNKLQVTLDYTKKDGTLVQHTGGIYEIRSSEGCLFLWDTNSNDSIRKFLIGNINNFQVLDAQFFPPNPWPITIDGQTIL